MSTVSEKIFKLKIKRLFLQHGNRYYRGDGNNYKVADKWLLILEYLLFARLYTKYF